jgi:hypothetical protein
MPVQPLAPSPVRASTEARTFTIDGVTVEVSAADLPESAFSVTEPGSASQWAVAADMDPYWEVSVVAVPFGTTAGVESLPIAQEGGSDAYRDGLAKFRTDQQAELLGTPTATLFGQSVVGAVYQIMLPLPASDEAPALLAEWVAEAGKRLWIARWARELSDVDADPNDTLTLTASDLDLAVPTTVGAEASRADQLASGQAVTLDSPYELPIPHWWTGDCDHDFYLAETGKVPSRLGATYRGMPACKPRPAVEGPDPGPPVSFFPGAHPELEWQCVELSMRYLYLAYGIEPYSANGYAVVTNYSGSKLNKVTNGTSGQAPHPGDVLQSGVAETGGHTSIVTAESVNGSGNGTITVIEQNGSSTGWNSLSVSNWVVSGGVTKWLTDPAPPFADDIAMGKDHQDGTIQLFRYLTDSANNVTGWNANLSLDPADVDDRMVAGDFTNDGKDDAGFLVHKDNGGWKIRVSASAHSTTLTTWYDTDSTYSFSFNDGRLVSGDFDGDGYRDDIAMAKDHQDGTIQLFRYLTDGANNVTGWNDNVSLDPADVDDRMVAGDFTNDGIEDVAFLVHKSNGGWKIRVSASAHSTSLTTWYDTDNTYSFGLNDGRLVSGDFDADGYRDDIAMGKDHQDGTIQLFRYLTDGANNVTAWNGNIDVDPARVDERMVAGDFNNDFTEDVAFLASKDNGGWRLRVSASAHDSPVTWYDTDSTYSFALNDGRLVSGDFDGQ